MKDTTFRSACLAGIAVLLSMAAKDSPPEMKQEPMTYAIVRRGTATMEDAYRVFVAMAQGHGRITSDVPADEMSFEQLAEHLAELCVIDADSTVCASDCLRRDVLAYMSASYIGCRPGVITGLCGMTRRYAHREMLYRGIIAPGAPNTLVSGSELLSVATRVARRVEPHRSVILNDNEIH